MSKPLKSTFIICIILITLLIFIIKMNIPQKAMKFAYPKMYSEYVDKYSKDYCVDPLLIYAVIKAESKFDEKSISNSNAKGIMQVMDATANEVAKDIGINEGFNTDMLFDAKINIQIGTKYLADLIQKYNGNYYLALAAYNAGKGTVDKWINEGIIKSDGSDIENIPYKETNNYVRKIVRDYEIYGKLYK